jgi:hypothetical protein
MTDRPNPARIAADAVFKTVAPAERQTATAEYKLAQEHARQRMAQQRAARLAQEKWAQRIIVGLPTDQMFPHSPTRAKRYP